MIEKDLLAYPDVFADAVNVLLFRGEQVIKPSELSEAEIWKSSIEEWNQKPIRDVAMKWLRNGRPAAVIGFLNETEDAEDMVLRVMEFTVSQYQRQLDEMNDPEDPDQKLIPVFAFVLNFGMKRWSSPLALSDIVEDVEGMEDYFEEMEDYFNDFRYEAFDLAFLKEDEIEMCRSDFRFIVEFLAEKRKQMTGDF